MVRTLRISLEENLGCSVNIEHPIVPWLVRYAGEVITRFRVRRDGRTAFRKLKGYDPSKPVVEVLEVACSNR